MDIGEVETVLRKAICGELAISPDMVKTTTFLGQELDIDSLDVLNIAFRVEQELGVKLPVQDWLKRLSTDELDMSEMKFSDFAELIASAAP